MGGDKPLGPKGHYFTGDRELSLFLSFALGLRTTYALEGANGHLAGLMRSLKRSFRAVGVSLVAEAHGEVSVSSSLLSRPWV